MKSITNERQKEKKSYASEFCLDHRKGNSNYNYEENNYNYKATALTSPQKWIQIDIHDVSSIIASQDNLACILSPSDGFRK